VRLLFHENLSPRPEGPPPKAIWLSVGNAGTETIALLLKGSRDRIEAFQANPEEGLLVIESTSEKTR